MLDCKNGGICEVDHCICPPSWKGDNCAIPSDLCQGVVCKNSGNCTVNNTISEGNDQNPVGCSCPSNFTGADCGEDNDECAIGSVCDNGGECVNTYGGYLCLCAAGFEGPTCGYLVNNCASDPCMNGGACQNGLNKYTCQCNDNYSGLNCEISNTETCMSMENQCHFGGKCELDPLLNRHTCNCSEGYTGEFCLYEYQPCVEAKCQHPGTSECMLGSCVCNVGYTGQYCETETICISSPCENGGTCQANQFDVSTFSCQCAPGYTGNNCETLFISECSSQLNCSYGTCLQYLGADFCKCAAGWGGKDCSIDINECSQLPCQNGGTCSNTIGSYNCVCPEGYSGEDCTELVVPCTPNPCQNGGSCLPGISPVCSCQPGYSGPLCETEGDACPTCIVMSVCCILLLLRNLLGI